MDPWIIFELIGGIIAGLLIGPLVYVAVGLIAYLLTERKFDTRLQNKYNEHKESIARIKKQYEKENNRYMKYKIKVEKFVEREKPATQTKGMEPGD